jgi:thiamine-phosphate pyrophosphorylase
MLTRIPRLYLITDRHLAGGSGPLLDILSLVAASLPPGEMAVQIREKDMTPRELIELVRAVVQRMEPRNVPVLVNDRLDIAIAAGAAGVHLGSSGLAPSSVRAAYSGTVAISTHSALELTGLAPTDIDFAVFGPVFDTPSKRPFGLPVGIDALRVAAASSPVPVLALGGINAGNAQLLANSGAVGLAVISAIMTASDPAASARELWKTACQCRG